MDRPLVLILDHDEGELANFKQRLGTLPLMVLSCTTASEALHLLASHDFAVAMIASELSAMEDLGLLRLIRRLPACKELPIVLLGYPGCSPAQGDALLLEDGFIDILGRPLASALVIAKVRFFCRLYEQKQQLQRSGDAALQASTAKTEFLTQLSHEIRTPLHSLVGVIDVLAERVTMADWQPYIDLLRKSADNVLRIVNDILDLSKIEAGVQTLERVPFSLSELVQTVVATHALKAEEKGVTLRLEEGLGVGAERVYGDPLRLQQVFHNLLSNAVKFTAQGEVRFSVGLRNADDGGAGLFCFQVSDTGIGIPADRLSCIFDMFAQAESSTSRHYGGTGLGLTICKRLLALMGGELTVSSQPNVGTTFTVSLRMQKAAKGNLTTDGSCMIPDLREPLRPLSILVADDCKDSRFLIEVFLRQTPHTLTAVTNGEEALEQFMQASFDLVIMDMQMPVMDGYAAAAAIRRWELEQQRQATPILALTGHAFTVETKKILAAGCNVHLSKPVRKKILLDAIAQLVS